ncbi:ITCH [Symbiodinium natans]|uniref:ITCH protein n=1 Tax=Symbiodinium natans TaxID=878477 RepID=A0A812U5F6_9DINO|nr:ITCH [Symbiodinium natans]
MLSYLAGLGPDPCFETQNPKPTTQNPKGIQLWTGSPDVFAHTLQFTGDADSLRGGEKVTFDTEWDERKQKTRAVTWQVDFSAGAVAMRTGRLQRFFAEKGFGFIQADEGGDDIFAHSRQFTGGDPDMLKEGERVLFEAEWDDKKNNNKAVRWCLESGGPGFAQQQGGGCYGGQSFGAPSNFGGPAPGPYGPMGQQPNDPRFSPYGGGPGGFPQQGCGGPCGGGPGFGGGPGPGGAGPLPPGWEQVTDPSSGRPYYCNRTTNETRWDPPPAGPTPGPMGGAPSGLPPGWEQVTDPSSGRPYYCNRSTGQTSWDPPQGNMGGPGGAPGGPGWEQASDPNSGKTYYFNRATNEKKDYGCLPRALEKTAVSKRGTSSFSPARRKQGRATAGLLASPVLPQCRLLLWRRDVDHRHVEVKVAWRGARLVVQLRRSPDTEWEEVEVELTEGLEVRGLRAEQDHLCLPLAADAPWKAPAEGHDLSGFDSWELRCRSCREQLLRPRAAGEAELQALLLPSTLWQACAEVVACEECTPMGQGHVAAQPGRLLMEAQSLLLAAGDLTGAVLAANGQGLVRCTCGAVLGEGPPAVGTRRREGLCSAGYSRRCAARGVLLYKHRTSLFGDASSEDLFAAFTEEGAVAAHLLTLRQGEAPACIRA